MSSASSLQPPPFPVARFSVEQYHRMVESGAFTEEDRLELIEGWVIEKMAKGPAHEYSVGQLEEFIRDHLPAGWHVRNQAPITLARSEPEPDLTIARGTRGEYRNRHPGAADVALAVEVSDRSLAIDRQKGRAYGVEGIAEYWIVNLPERCIEVYTGPTEAKEGSAYGSCTVLREGDEIRLVIAGKDCGRVAVAALLP